MAKIIAIFAAVLFIGSCVPPDIAQNPSAPVGGSRETLPSPQAAPAVRGSLLFPGRSIEEVTIAAKIGLADCRYAIKSSDGGNRFIVASRTGADPVFTPMASVQVFSDASGAPGVRILVSWPGPAGNPSVEIPEETEKIFAAIWNLLR